MHSVYARRVPFAPAPTRLAEDLRAETERIKTVRTIRTAVVEGEQAKAELKRMSVIDKLKLVTERRVELTKKLDDGAQQLLDRYNEVDKKADNSFSKHHARLTAEETAADELAHAVDQLSNDLGNLPS